jgi:hypothetical protein
MPTDLATARAALTAVLPLVPGAVQVTLRRTDPDDGSTIATAADVWGKRTKAGRSEAGVGAEGGPLGEERVQWRLEANGVAFTVQPSDRITDPDGVVWVVLSVDTAGLGRRFVCQCVREK